MATTLTSPRMGISMTASLAGGVAPATETSTVSDTSSASYTVGSASGNVGSVYSTTLTINTASATSVDLTSLTDSIGNAITASYLMAFKITNTSTTSGQDITIGGGSNAIITNALPVLKAVSTGNSTAAFNFGGAGVTIDSTHKIITIAAAAGSAVPVTITLFIR